MPVYNVEKYITECMDSIVSQETRWSFLVTVVNDGSPDRSRELLRKYESLPNVQIIDQENRGSSRARNTALRHIRGKYVMFVDSDDSLRPGAVEALMNTAKEYNCDIVQGGSRMFIGERTLSQTAYPDAEHNSSLLGLPWGKVYRAELFGQVCFPEGYWFQDTVLFLIVFELAERIRTTSAVAYNYRRNVGGVTFSAKGNPKSLDSLYITRRLMQDRRLLGLGETQQLYDKFLYQLFMNMKRILSIPSRNVWVSVFEESQKLREEYFKDFRTAKEEYRPLEEALLGGDFRAFFRAITALWTSVP